MAGRTRRTMIAEAFGEEIEYGTSGSYTLAGVVMYPEPQNNFPLAIVAVGNSPASVARRTRTVSRRVRPGLRNSQEHHVMQVVPLHEATAPVVRNYFGTHAVSITQAYHPEHGWRAAVREGGKSVIRDLAALGYTAVSFRHSGRSADFQAAELLKSMNARRKN